VRKAGRRPLCFYGGVFPHSFFNKKAVRGLSPKAHVALRLRYPKTSLFVYFECDSLSEELEKEEVELRRNSAKLGNSVELNQARLTGISANFVSRSIGET
jgi:hypothetical protein